MAPHGLVTTRGSSGSATSGFLAPSPGLKPEREVQVLLMGSYPPGAPGLAVVLSRGHQQSLHQPKDPPSAELPGEGEDLSLGTAVLLLQPACCLSHLSLLVSACQATNRT